MRILLLAPSNYEFSFEICKELERKKHEVKFIEDKTFACDYYLSYNNKTKRILKYIIGRSTKKKNIYWRKMFNDGGELHEYHCDLLLCINGYSLCENFFLQLKKNNPDIRLVYYLWDSCRLYAFHKNFRYFDKCFTFDIEDAKKFQIEYLPMFWMPVSGSVSVNEKPRVFFVGSIHSDRYQVLKAIISQLNTLSIDYYIKLYVPRKMTRILALRVFVNKMMGINNVLNDIYEILSSDEKPSFIVDTPINLFEFNKEMAKATHIIDIEQPCQTALAPRVVQALAMGKRIISTNYHFQELNFYDLDYVWLIDRNKPIIDITFLKSRKKVSVSNSIQELELSKWIYHLLEEKYEKK